MDLIKKEVKAGLSEDSGKDAEAEVQKVRDKYVSASTKSSPPRRKKSSPYSLPLPGLKSLD